MRPLLIAATGLLLAAMTGCGTVHNFTPAGEDGPPLEIYGGVTRSVERMGYLSMGDVKLGPSPFAAFWLPDVALSAVADTLTLPVTMVAAIGRAYTSEPPSKPGQMSEWHRYWFNNQPPATDPPQPPPP